MTRVQPKLLPYGQQWLDEDDIAAVVRVLRSNWLTTGPKVEEFERAFADFVGVKEAVAVNSGTAALHATMYAIGVKPGDEVIVPALTFAASANCVVYQGGTPIFADVEDETLLLDPAAVEARITSRTKAVVAVDYAGHPCEYDALSRLCRRRGLFLVADACHSFGGRYRGQNVGALADMSAFSFHPVKPITTGEGGMITTNDCESAARMRIFRNHGIATDHRKREQMGTWFYEMVDLGFNYRITDIQCALGLSQLDKLPGWVIRRREIARYYDAALAEVSAIRPLAVRKHVAHAHHLYVVRLDPTRLQSTRSEFFGALRTEGIGANVHYVPVYLHPFYRRRFGTGPNLCPRAEAAFDQILSLPIFPKMSDADVEGVVTAVTKLVERYSV